jgi:hypothetical protein
VPGKGQPRLPPGLVQTRAADSAPAAAGASLTANRNMFLRMSARRAQRDWFSGTASPWKGEVMGLTGVIAVSADVQQSQPPTGCLGRRL